MNRQKQIWLVMLYAMNEMDGGGGRRKDVLAHINSRGYWKKNDSNDAIRASRNEPVWRNNFSFEREHLADAGYMQPGGNGVWKITDSGRQHLSELIGEAVRQPDGAGAGYTDAFSQTLRDEQDLTDDLLQDEILMEQLAAEDIPKPEAPPELSSAPRPPRTAVARRNGHAYRHDPAVSDAALTRAGNRCQIDPAHTSFLRRDGQRVYMEPHHLIPLSKTRRFNVDLDREQNIICLCCTCHKQIHYGRREDVRAMLEKLFLPRRQDICAILGQDISLEELFALYENP